jgi:muramidase (phage lysozyme)
MANTMPAVTPYLSGHTIDGIPNMTQDTLEQDIVTAKYQSLVGSLLCLAYATHPDICVATSILAQYSNIPSSGHYDAT